MYARILCKEISLNQDVTLAVQDPITRENIQYTAAQILKDTRTEDIKFVRSIIGNNIAKIAFPATQQAN